MMKNKIALVSLSLLFLTACGTPTSPDSNGPDDDSVGPAAPSELQPESQMPVPEITDPAEIPEEMIVIDKDDLPPDQENLVALARQSLAAKFGYALDKIFLFSITPIDWPDASLGCPQPGIEYAEVITPGYMILLESKGQVATFHTDTSSQVILCEARGPDEIFIKP